MKPIEELNLTRPQAEVLKLMEVHKGYSAVDLQVSLAPLNALSRMGILEKKSGIGHTFSPRTAIKFRIAEEKTKESTEVTCEQLKGIRVTKGTVLAFGGCNGCSASYPTIRTIYQIELKGVIVRVCGTCKTVLLKQLRRA